MQVMGITNEQEILVVDRDRAFQINEYLVMQDESQGRLVVGEVIETQSLNRFLPFDAEHGPSDTSPFDALANGIGYDLDQNQVHWAKVRLLVRVPQPIKPGTVVRVPRFEEVHSLLIQGDPDPARSMVLGEIHATELLGPGLPALLRDRLQILEEPGPRPQRGVPFLFDPRLMAQYPHIGIFGGSGSGKSFGLRVLLEELMRLGIPTLVLDPHYEMSFTARQPAWPSGRPHTAEYSARHQVFRAGVDVGVKFTDLSSRDLTYLLGAAAAISDQMAGVVEALHRRGDSYQSFAGRVDDLADALEAGKSGLQRRLQDSEIRGPEREEVLRKQRLLDEFSALPAPSVKGVSWRLRRLHNAGLFNHDIRAIELAIQSARLAVVQGPIWLLQVFASYVVGNLYRQRRDYKDAGFQGETRDYFPPFVVATDEAHNFAPKGYDAPAKGVIKEIAQEGRKYGVFLILATQRPTLLDETVTAQLNTKCVFRTVRATDIATIKEETDLTAEEARRLPFLRSGDSYVSSAIFGRTVPVRIRMAETASPHADNPFDELRRQADQADETFLADIATHLPINPTQLTMVAQRLSRDGRRYSVAELEARLDALVLAGRLERRDTAFGAQYLEAPH